MLMGSFISVFWKENEAVSRGHELGSLNCFSPASVYAPSCTGQLGWGLVALMLISDGSFMILGMRFPLSGILLHSQLSWAT